MVYRCAVTLFEFLLLFYGLWVVFTWTSHILHSQIAYRKDLGKKKQIEKLHETENPQTVEKKKTVSETFN